jgi:hypothetical protein
MAAQQPAAQQLAAARRPATPQLAAEAQLRHYHEWQTNDQEPLPPSRSSCYL